MIKDMIEEYLRGGGKLGDAIQGLAPADFQATPVPGAWSIQQIVLHLMDSDLVASDRMKRIIAEENPT
ncbi:MAG: DinB family protein, partial [Phycisphaerae bacterium]